MVERFCALLHAHLTPEKLTRLTGKIEHRIALEDAVSVIDVERPTSRPTPRKACSQSKT